MSRQRLNSKGTYVLDPGVKCRCGNQGTHWVVTHSVDHCTPDAPNLEEFMCEVCIARLIVLSVELLALDSACSTCGMGLVSLSDIIVVSKPVD